MRFNRYPRPAICPYCEDGGEVVLTSNDVLYGRKYYTHGNCMCYVCIACDASVGTHRDGETPLGRLADKKLKALRDEAYALFNPLWKPDNKKLVSVRNRLAKQLGISPNECHLSWFDEDLIIKAIAILETMKARKR